MEFLGWLGDGIVGTIVPFLFVLTVIVFFHELGHYLVGRWCGIRVLAFSIGFGPELVGFNDRRGTRWKICAIPLGGYVKFFGDENAASMPDTAAMAALTPAERNGAFPAASVWRRAATVAAGPIANFILAIAIFAAVAYVGGRVVGDPVVAQVQAGSPAEAAGIRPGDRILAADGEDISYFSDFQRHVAGGDGAPIALTLEREGQRLDLTVTPETRMQTDNFGNEFPMPLIGIAADDQSAAFRTEELSLLQSVSYGASQTWFVTERTVHFIGGIFTGSQPSDQIGGPIRIAQVSGQVATLGFAPLLNLAALLSISIGLLNLLPIPMLDGGHLLFYAYEAARGKPLSERVQEIGFRIGLAMVVGLMVFAFWNDLASLT
jgi:regulator of sigma E protease